MMSGSHRKVLFVSQSWDETWKQEMIFKQFQTLRAQNLMKCLSHKTEEKHRDAKQITANKLKPAMTSNSD